MRGHYCIENLLCFYLPDLHVQTVQSFFQGEINFTMWIILFSLLLRLHSFLLQSVFLLIAEVQAPFVPIKVWGRSNRTYILNCCIRLWNTVSST